MKHLFLLLSAFLVLTACSETRSDPSASKRVVEIREAHDFSRIVFTGTGNLFLHQGDKEEIELEADESLLPYITTQVTNGTLSIEEKPGGWLHSYKSQTSFDAHLYFKNIEAVNLAGKGIVRADKEIKSNSLTIKVSGAGKVNLALETEHLTTSINGSAKYRLTGKATNQNVQISGSGLYNASQLISQYTVIDIRGSGQADVNVQTQLNVIITGKGLVRYVGKPQITKEIFGSGDIEELPQ